MERTKGKAIHFAKNCIGHILGETIPRNHRIQSYHRTLLEVCICRRSRLWRCCGVFAGPLADARVGNASARHSRSMTEGGSSSSSGRSGPHVPVGSRSLIRRRRRWRTVRSRLVLSGSAQVKYQMPDIIDQGAITLGHLDFD